MDSGNDHVEPEMIDLERLADEGATASTLKRCPALLAMLAARFGLANLPLTRRAQVLKDALQEVVTRALSIRSPRPVDASQILAAGALFGLITDIPSSMPEAAVAKRNKQYTKTARIEVARHWFDPVFSVRRFPKKKSLEAFHLAFLDFLQDGDAMSTFARGRGLTASGGLVVSKFKPASPLEGVNIELVTRHEYIEQIRSLIEGGDQVVCLWGEGGTGKTILAAQAGKALADDAVLTLRAGNPQLLNEDVIEALIAEGIEPSSWTESYCRVALRRAIADSPRSRLVVINDVANEEIIWQLVPRGPKIPVLYTARTESRDADVTNLEVYDFTEEQACTFIQENTIECRSSEALSLATALGNRPLALSHAVLYLRESSGVGIAALADEISKHVTVGLGLVALPSQSPKSLIYLYRTMLSAIEVNDDACYVLDSFLAQLGKNGYVYSESVWIFAEKDSVGLSRARYIAAFRTLADYGLIRTNEESPRKIARLKGSWLIMHPLTFQILRELRILAVLDVEARYLRFLLGPDVILPEEAYTEGLPYSAVAVARFNAWNLKQELLFTADIAEGWKYLLMIDHTTWVAIREDDNKEGQTYVARYEVLPTSGTLKLDYRTGVKARMTAQEAPQFYQAAKNYYQRVRTQLYGHVEETEVEAQIRQQKPARKSDSDSR